MENGFAGQPSAEQEGIVAFGGFEGADEDAFGR